MIHAPTRPLVLALCAFALGVLSVPAPAPARARYLKPVVKEDKVFPVARSNWYSVINFTNDWHEPRMRLIGGKWQQVGVHEGTDIFAEPGTPVRSIYSGVVENVGWTFYSGWRVGVRGDDGRYWFYAHLSEFAPGMIPGARVETGDALGNVGNTGYGYKPGHRDEFTWHLHFGLQEADGTWINPYPMLRTLYDAATRRAR